MPIFAHLKAECLPKLAPTNIALKIPFFLESFDGL